LGWEAVFYIHGGLASIWLVLWAVLVTDTPNQNRFISDKEKHFIADHRAHSDRAADEHKVILYKTRLKILPVLTREHFFAK
jgi:hypothetical protein